MLPNKSLKYNAFWNILSNVLNILLLFILTPIITKGLGDAQYGIYIILGTIGGALSIINLGLGEATLRYVAFYYSKNDNEGAVSLILCKCKRDSVISSLISGFCFQK